MASIYKEGNKVAIMLTDAWSGQEGAVHIANTQSCSTKINRIYSGLVCTEMTALELPTYDGAKTKIVSYLLTSDKAERKIGRVRESVPEIIRAFQDARREVDIPALIPQSNVSRLGNKVLCTIQTARAATPALPKKALSKLQTIYYHLRR
jgi:hypothetical protein